MFLMSSLSNAQFYQPLCNKAFNTTERPLIVVIDDFSCLPQADSIIKKNWPYSSNISFKTNNELDLTLKYNPNGKWVILCAGYRDEIKKVQGEQVAIKVFAITLYLSEDASSRMGKNVDKNFVFKMDYPHCINSELEMTLFLKQASQRIDYMKPKEMSSKTIKKQAVPFDNIQKASLKTMLIPKELLDIPIEEISKIYKYPYKVLSLTEIQKLALTGSTDQMIMNIMWSDKKNGWSLMLIDLDDFNINLSIPLRKLEVKATKTDFEPAKKLAIEKIDLKIDEKLLKKMDATIVKLLAKG